MRPLVSLVLAAGLAYGAVDLYTSEDVEAVVNPGAFTVTTPPPTRRLSNPL